MVTKSESLLPRHRYSRFGFDMRLRCQLPRTIVSIRSARNSNKPLAKTESTEATRSSSCRVQWLRFEKSKFRPLRTTNCQVSFVSNQKLILRQSPKTGVSTTFLSVVTKRLSAKYWPPLYRIRSRNGSPVSALSLIHI